MRPDGPHVTAAEALAWRDGSVRQLAGYRTEPCGLPAAMDYGVVLAFIDEAGALLSALLREVLV